ncbi:MAG TPA: alpha/beta hydrolase [Flavobacteriaceae bacterium]|nr:alpha/beta hydrolase [Flavobacteriaceae bacterium]
MKISFFRIWSLVLFITLTVSCSKEDDTTQEEEQYLEEKIMLNVSYGSHPQQVYDLYLPAGRSSQTTKIMMIIHGGGWTEGDKNDMNTVVNAIRESHPQYAVVNVNYILATLEQPAFPNQFLDIKTIIQKLTSEKEEHQIKPEFGLIGASAGGHIALMYDYVYDSGNQVKFVANIVGPTDFTDPFFTDQPGMELVLMLLTDIDAYPPGVNLFEALSPAYQVSASSSPTCSFMGISDPLVPVSNGHTLHQKLLDKGIHSVLRTYEGGHADNWSQTDVLDMHLTISDFAQMYLP